jgi:aspartyl protease family protein
MNGDRAASILYIMLLMVLVGSALVARRLPLAKSLKMILAWVAIFAVVIVLFSLLVRP